MCALFQAPCLPVTCLYNKKIISLTTSLSCLPTSVSSPPHWSIPVSFSLDSPALTWRTSSCNCSTIFHLSTTDADSHHCPQTCKPAHSGICLCPWTSLCWSCNTAVLIALAVYSILLGHTCGDTFLPTGSLQPSRPLRLHSFRRLNSSISAAMGSSLFSP